MLVSFMRNPMPVRIVIGVFVLVSVLSAGQAGTPLRGRVSDGSSPVAGAIVTVSNKGFVKSVTTDDDGRFMFESVPPGRYDFRTSASGYVVHESSVVVHSDEFHRNWIEVKGLVPADQQTVSVVDLALRKQARN
jgi:carboxypeptidase family protein